MLDTLLPSRFEHTLYPASRADSCDRFLDRFQDRFLDRLQDRFLDRFLDRYLPMPTIIYDTPYIFMCCGRPTGKGGLGHARLERSRYFVWLRRKLETRFARHNPITQQWGPPIRRYPDVRRHPDMRRYPDIRWYPSIRRYPDIRR